LKLFCPQHPMVGHWLTVARNKLSPPLIFRGAVAELGRCLIYEASQSWLPTLAAEVETPQGMADCQYVDQSKPVHIVPILRAGLVLLESAATVLPSTVTHHVGYVRDEKTLEASMYLNKLPEKFSSEDKILVCDTMVATGGTLVQLLQELEGRGANQENIRVITVVIAAQACNYLAKNKFDRIRVYCAMIDEKLDEQGYIVPGLGDAGDRSFGT